MASKFKDIDEPIFKDKGAEDYFQVTDNIKRIYFSDGLMATLMDFERVLDDLGVYGFKNWEYGELIAGPNALPYSVSCIFMWPEELMPDPRGARRLLPFDCKIKFKLTNMKVPMRIEDPSDYRPGTHKAKMIDKKVWLVQINMPKNLMNDIKTGSVELEDEVIDLEELENSYDLGLDKAANGGASESAAAPPAPPM